MTADPADPHEHRSRGLPVTLARVTLVFAILTAWCFFFSVAYVYGGEHGWIGWIRLPEGLTPFLRLDLTIADVGALVALFVAILLAATVQLNSTVSAADDIASARPQTRAEAEDQRQRLRFFTNQAEISLIVSYGAVFAVLLLTVLFGLADLAGAVEAGDVDARGVGWAGFLDAARHMAHPRFMVLYAVSFLLLLTAYSSMPEWKHTGLFQRQVEGSAWESARRLEKISRRHDLADVGAIVHPGRALGAALTGYALYVMFFALLLNLSLSVIVGGERFDGFFSAGHRALFFVFVVFAALISVAVGSVMLWVHLLHGSTNVLVVVSIALGVLALLYVMSGEGLAWAVAVAVAVAVYAGWWGFLYWRAAEVLDEKAPTAREFLLNPPKFIVVQRYEAIRRSAARVTG